MREAWYGVESCLRHGLESGYCASLLMIFVNISQYIPLGRTTCQLVTRGVELQSKPTAPVERGVQVAVSQTPDPAFTLTVDYLAFTLPSSSVGEVISRLHGDWVRCSGGYRGYTESWVWDVGHSTGYLNTGAVRNPREVNVDLPGEIVSTWPVEMTQTILAWILAKNGHLTRIDCALDDLRGSVPIDTVRKAIEAGQLVTRAKSYGCTNRRNTSTDALQGETIYIGSVKSETLLRIYDKRLQVRQKGRDDWALYGNRWELQLRNTRAQALAWRLAKSPLEEWRRLVIGAVRSFADFRDVTRSLKKWERSRGKLISWWAGLTEGFESARLSVSAPTDRGLTTILKWLKQMAPTLSLIVDLPGGRDILEAAIEQGRSRRKPKHLKVLWEYGGLHDEKGAISDLETSDAETSRVIAV